MIRIFVTVFMIGVTFQCYMHTLMVGYNHSTIVWWLLNFGIFCLAFDGYKIKK